MGNMSEGLCTRCSATQYCSEHEPPAVPEIRRETRDELDRVLCPHGRPMTCLECGEEYTKELNTPDVRRVLIGEPLKEDVVCEHGTAMDVHCCNCHSGFLFDAESCVCAMSDYDRGYNDGYAAGLDESAGDPRVERLEAGFKAIQDATNGDYSREDRIVLDALQGARDYAVRLARRETHIQQLIAEKATVEAENGRLRQENEALRNRLKDKP